MTLETCYHPDHPGEDFPNGDFETRADGVRIHNYAPKQNHPSARPRPQEKGRVIVRARRVAQRRAKG